MDVTDAPCAVMDRLPPGFLDCPADRLVDILPGPTLFDLPGRDPNPLFVSTLLHGNEYSGLDAMQQVLRAHAARGLPRALLFFVGNIRAAAANLRTLPDERDYNRVWPGSLFCGEAQAEMARWVYDYAKRRGLFASIDIHNNTGFNPHYACVRRLEPKFIALAQLFSRIVVHFQRPVGTQAAAFADLCPAITVECGKAGAGSATQHAVELVEAALSIAHLPDHPPAPHDVDILRTCAIVKPPAEASFSFDGAPADFMFRSDIDHLNFSELTPGASFGVARSGMRLDVLPGDGDDAQPGEYFDYAGGEIRLSRAAIPAMLTIDPRAVKLDCLCYLMHRIGMDGERRDG
ncbi:M14 family metallopeptidase [Methylocystis parvus]|nr:M14 family metallopeptidase [Methylocystis parvus]WBK00992.1 M14 family metallopeptidase [Methylocystis parvus OBBP]